MRAVSARRRRPPSRANPGPSNSWQKSRGGSSRSNRLSPREVSVVTTVVVATYRVATDSQLGGHFWVYLQYVHGLQQLGCDVVWLEQLPANSDTTTLPDFFRRMEAYGLGGKAILYREQPDGRRGDVEFVGATATEAESVFRRADILLNFHYAMDAEMLQRFRRSALIDIDPGLLQF